MFFQSDGGALNAGHVLDGFSDVARTVVARHAADGEFSLQVPGNFVSILCRLRLHKIRSYNPMIESGGSRIQKWSLLKSPLRDSRHPFAKQKSRSCLRLEKEDGKCLLLSG